MRKRDLENAFEELKVRGCVGYGKKIPKKTLEEVLDIEYSEDWDWTGPILQLRIFLEDKGYFVSQRGEAAGDIRFLHEREIPYHLQKRRFKRYEKMQIDLNACEKLPTSSLSDIEKKVLHHESDRLARDFQQLAASDPDFRKAFCE